MIVEIEKLTDRDIRQFKREIEKYKKGKLVFTILGFVFLGLTLFVLSIGIIAFVSELISDYVLEIRLIPGYLLFEVASIPLSLINCFITFLMFLLRAVLFVDRIDNRNAAIEEYEIYQQEQHEEIKGIDNIEETTEVR